MRNRLAVVAVCTGVSFGLVGPGAPTASAGLWDFFWCVHLTALDKEANDDSWSAQTSRQKKNQLNNACSGQIIK